MLDQFGLQARDVAASCAFSTVVATLGLQDRAALDVVHAAARAACRKVNGAPGLRPAHHPVHAHESVRDTGGHDIDAVCLKPEGAA